MSSMILSGFPGYGGRRIVGCGYYRLHFILGLLPSGVLFLLYKISTIYIHNN
jgi:hypothetical protein